MNLVTQSEMTQASAAIVEALNQAIAETAVTTMLAQNFHWNVTGMAFGPLHDLFQKIYEDHFEAQDELAERVKAIGGHAEGTLAGMVNRSKVSEHNGKASDTEMIQIMANAQEIVAQTLVGVSDVASREADKLTEDLCVNRAREHQKFVWMLKSHLANTS